MGIIDDYLVESPAAKPVVSSGTSLVDQYLAEPSASGRPKVVIDTTSKPPISGFSKEDSDRLNAEPGIQGGANPREGVVTGLRKLPGEMLQGILEDASSGARTASSQALTDATSGRPATALGDVGSGALQIITSPFTGPIRKAGEFITKTTGNKDFGDKAELIAGGAVPLWPVKSAVNVATGAKSANDAISILADKVTSNGREPQKLRELVQKMKDNPRIGPADESPAVLNMAQKLFTTEGDAAKNYLHNTSTSRVAGSKDAVNAAYDEASGLPVNAVVKLKELKDAAAKVGSEQINPAIKGSKPVNITPVIDSIDSVLTPGVMKNITGESTLPFPEVKKTLENVKAMMANETEQLTSAQELHNFQSLLRVKSEQLLRSTDGKDKQLGYALQQVRNKIVDAIDEASPKLEGKGSYKPALANFRTEKQIDEAFHDAYNGVLTNSKKLENRPEFTEQWFDGLTQHEKSAAKQALRTRVDTEIGVAKNPALAGTSLGKSDFNQKKMEAVLGKEETKKLLDTLEDERKISNTHNKIIEGSQTEMRRSGDEAIKIPDPKKDQEKKGLAKYVVPAIIGAAETGAQYLGGPMGLGSIASAGLMTAGAAAGKLGSKVSNDIAIKLAKERNFKLAKYVMPEGETRADLIQKLDAMSSATPKLSAKSKLRMLVSP